MKPKAKVAKRPVGTKGLVRWMYAVKDPYSPGFLVDTNGVRRLVVVMRNDALRGGLPCGPIVRVVLPLPKVRKS